MIGDFSIFRPWRTWLKVSAFFRRPATEWHFGRWRGGGRGLRFHAPWWRIIQFSAVDIVYRRCENDRPFAVESLPQYNILLLNRWLLQVRLVAPNKVEDTVFSLDDLYWETVIDVANGSLLREAVENNTWKLRVGSGEDARIHRSNAKTEGFLTDDATSFV